MRVSKRLSVANCECRNVDFRAPKPMVADSISRNGGVNYAGDADIDQEDFTHPFPG